jgi:hypothetical protein
MASTDCYYLPQQASARWIAISSSSGPQMVSYQVGVTRSHTVEDSTTWGSSVTESVSAGFSAFGIQASTSVSGTTSTTISHSYSSTFSMSSSTTFTYTFDAGVVWQWQFGITDGCGPSDAQGHDLALTANELNPPCCLPGMFVNISQPTSECLAGTPNLCAL